MTIHHNTELRPIQSHPEYLINRLGEVTEFTSMSVVCMHCRCSLGTKDGQGITGETSSICPDCVRKHYPRFADKLLGVK